MAESRGITNVIAGVAALLGVFATVQSTINSQKIETNRIDLERQQQKAEYQLAVFERVADAIETADTSPQKIRAAVSLVNTLPEEPPADGQQSLKQQLLIILVDGGLAAGGEAAEAVEQLRDQTSDAPDAAVKKDVQAPAMESPPQVMADAPAAARTRALESAPALNSVARRIGAKRGAGWNVDVFYCAGPNQAANEARANAYHQKLVAAVNRQTGEDDMQMGRIRLRTLTEEVNGQPGYEVKRDEVRAEGSELQQAEVLVRYLAQGGGAPLPIYQTRNFPTPYYLSVFACGA
jgi:hypothetical protein